MDSMKGMASYSGSWAEATALQMTVLTDWRTMASSLFSHTSTPPVAMMGASRGMASPSRDLIVIILSYSFSWNST